MKGDFSISGEKQLNYPEFEFAYNSIKVFSLLSYLWDITRI